MWLGSSVILPKEVSSQESRSSFKFESRGRNVSTLSRAGVRGERGALSRMKGCRFSRTRVIVLKNEEDRL